MSGFRVSNNIIIGGDAISVGASETNKALTKSLRMSAEDTKAVTITVVISASTVAVGITTKIQYYDKGVEDWADTALTDSIANGISAATSNLIEFIVQPGTTNPIPGDNIRVVISSGAGDSCTVDGVYKTIRS